MVFQICSKAKTIFIESQVVSEDCVIVHTWDNSKPTVDLWKTASAFHIE